MVIPVRGNKYYKPANWNYSCEPQNFWGVRIPKLFYAMSVKNNRICALSYSPKNNVFWQFFQCKYPWINVILSSLLLHRPVCENGCAHDVIPYQKSSDQNLRTVLKTLKFWTRPVENRGYCPDSKPPSSPRAATSRGGGPSPAGRPAATRAKADICTFHHKERWFEGKNACQKTWKNMQNWIHRRGRRGNSAQKMRGMTVIPNCKNTFNIGTPGLGKWTIS